MNFSAYIITKPLQYINVTNIEDENIKDLLIIPNFNHSVNFINSIKLNSSYWNIVKTYSTKERGVLSLIFSRKKYQNIFLDSDFGILLRILLFFLPNSNIYVYEEGIASYTKNIRNDSNLISKIFICIDKILLGGTWSGSSKVTKGIYLYHPESFKKILNNNLLNKNLLKFRKNYLEHIKELKEINYLFNQINFKKYQNINVLIYLSAGDINHKVFSILNLYPLYYKILKLHPNEKDDFENMKFFDESLNNSLPAELLITNLLVVTKNLIVVHESSAAILNIITNVNLNEYNIADENYKNKFEQLVEMFKTKSI